MTNREIIVCRDALELSRKAAAQFVDLAHHAIGAGGRFSVALSGGSTPKALYALLAQDEFSSRLDWPRIHLFWGDERCVAPQHADSNFRMVNEALLDKITIPAENIHRMAGEKKPEVAAAEYENDLGTFFKSTDLPRFDLILLGLGEDGHTASLFPGSAALHETQHWVSTVYAERLKAYRLTLTFPVINGAGQIMFLVSGASKRAIVKHLLGASGEPDSLPAAQVFPKNGKLTWLITADAAGDIEKS